MKKPIRLALMSMASVSAMCSAAFAQQAQPGSPGSSASTPTSASATPQKPAPSNAEGAAIEEVVVTANKRSENVQKVPISISSITAKTLAQAGVRSTGDLAATIPGLTMQESQNGLDAHIRGIGTTDVVAGNESSVATYIDGVYISVMSGAMLNLDNIAQVDVLKGPQGTLFGRNATGGVIDVRTKDPSQAFHMDAAATYGNYNTTSGNLYLTGGLTQTLSADLAVYGSYQADGYGKNLANGQDVNKTQEYAVRTKWLWKPTDSLTFRLAADMSYTNDNGLTAYSLVPGTSAQNPFGGPAYVNTFSNPWDIDHVYQPHWGFGQEGMSLTVDWLTDFAKLTSITAGRAAQKGLSWELVERPTTAPVQPTGWDQRSDQFSQEFQIASLPGSKISWVVGAFYLHSRDGYDPFFLEGAGVAPLERVQWKAFESTDAGAGYGQTTIPLIWDTNLTAGFRYSVERRSVRGDESFLPSSFGIPNVLTDASKVFSKPTWRLSLDHQFTRDIMGYVSYNRGFKSGVYNTIPPAGPDAKPLQPETIDAYEVGFKSELLDRRVRFNAAAFLYDYHNIQVDIYTAAEAIQENAPAARVYGVDFDMTARVTDRLTFNLSGSYVHDRFTDFPAGALSQEVPISEGGGRVAVDGVNLAGKRLPYTPDYTVNFGVNYVVLLSDGKLMLGGNYSYESKFYGGPDNTYGQPGFSNLNAQISWKLNNGLEFTAWGKNLTDTAHAVFLAFQNNGTPAGPSSGGFTDRILAPPRTFGLTIAFHM